MQPQSSEQHPVTAWRSPTRSACAVVRGWDITVVDGGER
jgi:hypothetical protein